MERLIFSCAVTVKDRTAAAPRAAAMSALRIASSFEGLLSPAPSLAAFAARHIASLFLAAVKCDNSFHADRTRERAPHPHCTRHAHGSPDASLLDSSAAFFAIAARGLSAGPRSPVA